MTAPLTENQRVSTDMYEPLIKKILERANADVEVAVRNYGGLSSHDEVTLQNIKEIAPTLRKLASLCYLTGINLKVTL